jgi:hypothetical protein
VFTGVHYTCVILDNTSLKCFGWIWGVGYGDYKNRGLLTSDMGDSLPAVPSSVISLSGTEWLRRLEAHL